MLLIVLKKLTRGIAEILSFFFLTITALYYRNKPRKYIFFGPTPLYSYANWARALKEVHSNTLTLMRNYYSIHHESDFDLYYKEVTPNVLRRFDFCTRFCAFIYIIRKSKLFISCFDSILLDGYLKPFEIFLFKLARVKTVLLPYGSDGYMYGLIKDMNLKHALLINYPIHGRNDHIIRRNVSIRNYYADLVITGPVYDGFPRWDVLTPQYSVIDTKTWKPLKNKSSADGVNQEAIIMHSPNHRGVKGTEFIINAIEELKLEGYKVKLNLLEGKKNDVIRNEFQEADIFIEHLAGTTYALSAVEALATGTPCISKFCPKLQEVFRRYSFLNECPIVSATPENIKQVIKALITNPDLRYELGQAGRAYAKKYHSYKTAQYMFGAIYDKLIDNKDVDLINLFHPLLSEYNKSSPRVKHPLINNNLPDKYFTNIPQPRTNPLEIS